MQKLGRFLAEALVVALAVYALFAVPMGKRTLAGHIGAVFTTPVAKEAASDVGRAIKRVASHGFSKKNEPSK